MPQRPAPSGEAAPQAETVRQEGASLKARRLAKELPKSAEAMRRSLQTPSTPPAQASAQQQLDRELWNALRVVSAYVRERAPRLHRRLWRLIPSRRLLTNAALVLGMIALAGYSPLSEYVKSGLHSVARNVRHRAAFQFVDDFTSGIGSNWDAAGMISDSGAARVRGFALNRNTMGLTGYRMDFDVKIAARGLGWVIGAADENNYYAFKLEDITGRKEKEKKYRLVRYLVAEGAAVETQRVNIDVPVPIDHEDFNRVSVRLRENRIATFINGTGVDYWQAEETPHGAVGFFTENNESALVRRVEVSGNEDTWGLFLFGFLELIEDAKDFVEPVTANSRSTTQAAPVSSKPTGPAS